MPKIRKKPYRAGDKITFQIPRYSNKEYSAEDIELILKFINSQKMASPAIINSLLTQARKVYGKE